MGPKGRKGEKVGHLKSVCVNVTVLILVQGDPGLPGVANSVSGNLGFNGMSGPRGFPGVPGLPGLPVCSLSLPLSLSLCVHVST